jgi:hypothetical protein
VQPPEVPGTDPSRGALRNLDRVLIGLIKPQNIMAPNTLPRNGQEMPFWKRRNMNTSPRLRNPLREAVDSVNPPMLMMSGNPWPTPTTASTTA